MKKKQYLLFLVPALVLLVLLAIFYREKVAPAPVSNEEEAETSTVIQIADEPNTLPVDVTEEYLEELGEKYITQTLVVEDIEVSPSKQATVSILLVNNKGILGLSGALSYDESAMQLVSVENGSGFQETLELTSSESLNNGCRFVWDGLDLEPEQVKDGVLLKLTFQIHENAKSGRYPVTFTVDNEGVFDYELNPLELEVDCGYITVE